MRIALAQINSQVGDFAGNGRRIAAAARMAAVQGAELAVFPELAVVGYPPRDLLLDPGFVAAAIAATAELAGDLAGTLPVIVGSLARSAEALPGHPGLWNVAALLAGGRVEAQVPKRLLPIYDVFLEPRWFLPGPPSAPLPIGGWRVGILICEDLWDEGYPLHPPAELTAAGAELFVSLSASPYRPGIFDRRLAVARRTGLPIVCVNALGGNDELIFDGAGFALDGAGRLLARLPAFEEGVVTVDLAGPPLGPEPGLPLEGELVAALTLGIRDFADKSGLRRAFVGLSGSPGSAVVAVLATAALGPERVDALVLPPCDAGPRLLEAVRELVATLGIASREVAFEPLHRGVELPDSHLRAAILAAHADRSGDLWLGTSDKTELSRSSGSLQSDQAGMLSPLGDLTEPQVQALAGWLSAHRAAIPPLLLERSPGAEAATVPGPAAEIRRLRHGIVLKVSERAFGSGRLMPVTRTAGAAASPA